MAFRIDPSDRRPLYLQIVDEVRRARLLDLLAVDEPLPSVRQLAADLRINPNTVAQAYRELEREGVVHVRRGQGTFLTPSAGEDAALDRSALARDVALRAILDGARHGLSAVDLVEAIRDVDPAAFSNGTKT